MWLWTDKANHTFRSGKRNEVVDFVIVDLETAWPFGRHQWQRNALPFLRGLGSKFDFHAAENQFLHRTILANCLGLQLAIHHVRNVDRSPHGRSLPYLWLTWKIARMTSPTLFWISSKFAPDLRNPDKSLIPRCAEPR